MTVSGAVRPLLRVEGTDDLHAIRHLLVRRGIVPSDPGEAPDWYPDVSRAKSGGREKLLATAATRVSLSTGAPVGFVMDANDSLDRSWRAISGQIRKAGVRPPDRIPKGGFIGHSKAYDTRVGVWLMPNNQSGGAIESFIETLIPAGDTLVEHARVATEEAKRHGARFSDKDYRKAYLHAWLAWQEDPGRPYGTAIRARFFEARSETADAFVEWFRRRYDPAAAGPTGSR